MASKAITLSPELKPMLIAKFQSAEQRVMAELRQSLIESSPRAAAYLADVVDGLHESAPHSVRVQAAISKIGLAIQFTQESPEIKDLHSMGVSDLEASLQSLGRELASRTAEDVEVIEEPKHG